MQSLGKFKLNVSRILGGMATGLLLLGMACGAAATATPPPTSATTPGAPVVPAGPTPTAAPAPTTAPAAPVVHPGKLSWMIADWGNGRFDSSFAAGVGNNYGRIIHGFLIVTGERPQLLPGIATKWEISSDGKTWTFTIRDGAKFHDGKAITADDAWWTLMHYFGKDESGSAVERVTSGSAQGTARSVDRIQRVGPNQVSIITNIADAGLPAYLGETGPNWWGIFPRRPKVHDYQQDQDFDLNPIGAGPMRLVRYVPAELMRFERFEDFYYQPKNGFPEDRRVRFTTLDMRLIPEEATRVAAIRAGEADIAPASGATRKPVEAGGGRLVFGPEGIYVRAYFMGCYKPEYPCHDKRVRQALDYAIDKTVIRDQLFGGPEVFQAKGWAHITPSSIGYSPDLDPRPFDPNKARQLLAEAGYPGGKGFGKLIVNTWVSPSMPYLPESAQLAADFWRKELGLDVEVKLSDNVALNQQQLSGLLHGQFFWTDNETRLDPGNITKFNYATPGYPRRFHETQELVDFVQGALAVFEPAKRPAAFNPVFRRLREESYEMGIGYVNIPWAVGPRVAAWQPWPFSFYPSNLHGITLKSP